MSSDPQWSDALGDESIYQQAGVVEAALLTTYDPPDATLLVEDLLPRWFQLDREASSDESMNPEFLGQLEAELQRRRGKLAIISSPAILGEGSRHWIWSHVARHFVGAQGSVSQHAKLWLLHRVNVSGDEFLEAHVSSTNLTGSAVREQLQAGTRFLLKIRPKKLHGATRRWGALVPFLRELSRHSGMAAAGDAVRPWIELLARCECPLGMTFVASVPGLHSGRQWGATALGDVLPSNTEVDILVPTIGSWDKTQLEKWAKALGTSTNRIKLAWVPKGHPWALKWAMPKLTADAITRSRATLLSIGAPQADNRHRIHGDYEASDERWPHAKVYWFGQGTSTRVLVTSANWSTSAWGEIDAKGRSYIKNFELGVLLKKQVRLLSKLKPMTGKPATTTGEQDFEGAVPWSVATFDGSRLDVYLAGKAPRPKTIEVLGPDEQSQKVKCTWKKEDHLLHARHVRRWDVVPSVVILMLGDKAHWLAVHDLRTHKAALDKPLSRPPGISEAELKRMRARLLEERYGGRLMEDDPPNGGGKRKGKSSRNDASGDYGVWLLEEARRVFAVVDSWALALSMAKGGHLSQAINQDGLQLLENWREEFREGTRRSSALKIACIELKARLS